MSITLDRADFVGKAMAFVEPWPVSLVAMLLLCCCLWWVQVDGATGLRPAELPATDPKGMGTMKPLLWLLSRCSFRYCFCWGSIGFTPMMRTLFNCMPCFARAFRASYRLCIESERSGNSILNQKIPASETQTKCKGVLKHHQNFISFVFQEVSS